MGKTIVLEDFGGGCQITGELLPGETEKECRRRYAVYCMKQEEERKAKQAEQLKLRRLRLALDRWEPPKR